MTDEIFSSDSGCDSPSHEQHLCYMISQGFNLTDQDQYNALIEDPHFRCEKCGRTAKSEANLCKPVELSRYQAIVSEGFEGRTIKFKSVDEILNAAIIREMHAQELYTKMISMVENPWMKKVLAGFAQEELAHQTKLQAVKAGEITLTTEDIGDLSTDFADELEDIKPDPAMDYPEFLVFTIHKENKSLKLYKSMAALVAEPEFKQMFLNLAQEEANHKRRLEIEYKLTTS